MLESRRANIKAQPSFSEMITIFSLNEGCAYVRGLGMSPLGFLGGLSGKGTLHDACRTVESHVDVRADMVFAE